MWDISCGLMTIWEKMMAQSAVEGHWHQSVIRSQEIPYAKVTKWLDLFHEQREQ